MSTSVQKEQSNKVYNDSKQPTATSSTGITPSNNQTVVKETTIIRDSGRSGGGWFVVPLWLGGSGSDRTVVINNGQPAQVQTYNDSEPFGARQSGRGWHIFFFIIGVAIIGFGIYMIIRYNNRF
jgi:hypothetical protein